MKKILSIIFLLSISTVVMSGPYLMSKHEFKMKDTDYSSTINHIDLDILGKQKMA